MEKESENPLESSVLHPWKQNSVPSNKRQADHSIFEPCNNAHLFSHTGVSTALGVEQWVAEKQKFLLVS